MGANGLRWFDQARRDELERALRLLRSGHDAAGVAAALSRRLTNKLLHAPTHLLREQAAAHSTIRAVI